jgi:hypothetical protein
MKKYLILVLAIPLLTVACEKRKFEFAPMINLEKTYMVDQTGAFNETATISREDVLDLLDIPETAEIKDVYIESIAVKVIILENNAASAVLLSGKVQLGSSKPALFNDYPAPLVLVDDPWIGLNSLISEGVSGIKAKIEGYLEGSDTEPFDIELSGDSSPTSGNRIHVRILLKITGTVKYFDCMEVPFFVEGGDPC